MSLILRSVLRNPVATRPLSRAVARRWDGDWFLDDWPSTRLRRSPAYEPSLSVVDSMNRNMAAALNRMQEFAEDLEALDSLVSRFDQENQTSRRPNKRRREDVTLQRTENGGLQLALDVADYKPEDLSIKLEDDSLIVEAVSEASGEDSYRRSHFKRWFKLPEDCKVEEIRSKLTPDSRLVIDLPTKKPIESGKGKTIPIEVEQLNEKRQALGEKPDQQKQQAPAK